MLHIFLAIILDFFITFLFPKRHKYQLLEMGNNGRCAKDAFFILNKVSHVYTHLNYEIVQ
jgi:hypothetical protein